jgi:hypothetical protein
MVRDCLQQKNEVQPPVIPAGGNEITQRYKNYRMNANGILSNMLLIRAPFGTHRSTF